MVVENDDLSIRLADAIRSISEMIHSGAVCDDIAMAAAECAVSMVPGAHAIVIGIAVDGQSARIMASANAPFVVAGQDLPLPKGCIALTALAEPMTVHVESAECEQQLLSLCQDNPAGPNAVVACKVVPRNDSQSVLLILIADRASAAQANEVLMTLSELLIALCAGRDAGALHSQRLVDIARAKNEWEKTVDALPEVVCILDQYGNVVRSNRTVERWGLGDVGAVRGIHIHDLLHGNCMLSNCPLRDAVSLSMAAQTTNGYLESAITDPVLARTLIVHTRLMPEIFADDDTQQPQPSAVVVLSDISALQRAQQELATLNKDLEARVERRTEAFVATNKELSEEVTRRRAAERELQTSRDELADLTQQLIKAQEEERERLSRELHDSLGQSLGAIKYSLERVVAMLEHAGPPWEPQKEITSIVDRVGELIREARSMAMGLRPPMLDDIGAASAVDWLCQTFAKTFTDINFQVELEASDGEIPDQLSTTIYRIVQEAVNNVVKHASAKKVLVLLSLNHDVIQLEVLDDGIGFSNNTLDTGHFKKIGKMGRLGMRERAVNSNGLLTVESWPGEGTRVRAEWPLQEVRKLSGVTESE